MLEAMHDDGHDCDGFWHDAGGGNLSPRHFHLRGTWDRSFNQISALLISRANLDVRGHRDRTGLYAEGRTPAGQMWRHDCAVHVSRRSIGTAVIAMVEACHATSRQRELVTARRVAQNAFSRAPTSASNNDGAGPC